MRERQVCLHLGVSKIFNIQFIIDLTALPLSDENKLELIAFVLCFIAELNSKGHHASFFFLSGISKRPTISPFWLCFLIVFRLAEGNDSSSLHD